MVLADTRFHLLHFDFLGIQTDNWIFTDREKVKIAKVSSYQIVFWLLETQTLLTKGNLVLSKVLASNRSG